MSLFNQHFRFLVHAEGTAKFKRRGLKFKFCGGGQKLKFEFRGGGRYNFLHTCGMNGVFFRYSVEHAVISWAASRAVFHIFTCYQHYRGQWSAASFQEEQVSER